MKCLYPDHFFFLVTPLHCTFCISRPPFPLSALVFLLFLVTREVVRGVFVPFIEPLAFPFRPARRVGLAAGAGVGDRSCEDGGGLESGEDVYCGRGRGGRFDAGELR